MTTTKGYFKYTQKGKFKDCFDKTLWNRLFSENQIRTLRVIVRNNNVSFDIPYSKKSNPIDLDWGSIHSTTPEKFTEADYNSSYEFSIKSKPIEFVEESEGKYKFYNEKSEFKSVDVSDNLTFVRH